MLGKHIVLRVIRNTAGAEAVDQTAPASAFVFLGLEMHVTFKVSLLSSELRKSDPMLDSNQL